MVYSHKMAQERALQEKIRKTKIQAITQHSDAKMRHPDEARDASKKDFTKLVNRVKNEFEVHLKKLEDNRKKMGVRF